MNAAMYTTCADSARKLPLPGVGPLYREAVLKELCGVGGSKAGETLSCGVDDVQIAVGTVIPAQPHVCASCLGISRIELQNGRERKESGKRIIGLQAAKYDGEVSAGNWQAKPVPLLGPTERQALIAAVGAADACFVQAPVIVAAKTL